MQRYDEQANEWIPLRHTSAYMKKRSQVKNLWIGGALLMLTLPAAYSIALALLLTFVSFSWLDESRYEGTIR